MSEIGPGGIMWQPREDYWNYVRPLLESSVSGLNNANSSKSIEEFSKLPDSAFYFAFIFVFDDSTSEPARGLAGLLLKNKLRASLDCLDEASVTQLLQQIKIPLMQLIGSSNRKPFLQRTLCTVLATLVTDCNGLHIWPSLISDLLDVSREHPESIVTIFGAIERICEDAAFELIDHPEAFKLLLETVLRALPQSDQPVKLKCCLFSIVSHLIPTQAALLTENIDYLLESVFTKCEEEEVHVAACRLLSTLNEFYWTLLTVVQINKIFTFILMLQIRCKESLDVSKECAEFWLSVVQNDGAYEQFQNVSKEFLNELIPLLMDRCAYDDLEDEEELCRALEDLSVPDEAEEDLPRGIKHKKDDNETSDGIDEDADDYNNNDEEVVTSLRKCSAATLDGLSLCVDPPVFLQIFLPAFNERVGSNDWKLREAVLLAFGAVSEALWPKMSSAHLEQISGFLIANARSHPHPLVRSMSFWALSRLATWITSSSSNNGNSGLDDALRVMIGSLGDANKRVQQSAATALCRIIESCQVALFPRDHLKSLISALFLALRCYQRRSLLVLYDLIRTLCQNEAADPDSLLMNDIEGFQYWRSIAGWLIERFGPACLDDYTIFPLMEALMALLLHDTQGALLDPAQRDNLTLKALSLAAIDLQILSEPRKEDSGVGEDDVLIAALDLLAAAVESSQLPPSPQFHAILQSVLMQSIAYRTSSYVRQSAFALIGDYASLKSQGPLHTFFSEDFFSTYYRSVRENSLPTAMAAPSVQSEEFVVSMATATNALWSLGEMAVNLGKPVPLTLIEELVLLLRSNAASDPLYRLYSENLTVCVGRLLGMKNVPLMSFSSLLDLSLLPRFIVLLSTVESDNERCTALAGFLRHYDPASMDKEVYRSLLAKMVDLIDFSRPIEVEELVEQLRGRWLKHPQCQPADLPPLFRNFL